MPQHAAGDGELCWWLQKREHGPVPQVEMRLRHFHWSRTNGDVGKKAMVKLKAHCTADPVLNVGASPLCMPYLLSLALCHINY